jgi:hypothetical protein
MKSICFATMLFCAACGTASAVGGSTAAKGDVASAGSPSDSTKTADKPSPAPLAKDGGGGW